MRILSTGSLIAVSMAALLSLTACPGKLGLPGTGGGKVDPAACGDYASVNDAGRKLHAFLAATAELQDSVNTLSVQVRTGCDAMAKELGISPSGDNQAVCKAVLDELKKDMSVGVKADAHLDIKYTPAVCKVDAEAGASMESACEGSASSSGGSSGECKSQGQIHAAATMTCTPASLEVSAGADVIVKKPEWDKAVAAIKAGMGDILTVQAKIAPFKDAIELWATTAKGVIQTGKDLASQFKDQALCLTGQISALAAAETNIQASFSFSVSVSASASATAGAGG